MILASVSTAMGRTYGVLREVWTGQSSASMWGFTNQTTFPNLPDYRDVYVTNYLESPMNYSDNYGQRLIGVLTPPVTGKYVFWICGDNEAMMYLSPDQSAFNKTQINFSTKAPSPRAWYIYPEQQSTNIYLEAGRKYYVEVLHISGIAQRELVSVGWKLPDGTLQLPVPMLYFQPFGVTTITNAPILTHSPTNVTVAENSPVSFWVESGNSDIVSNRWLRNGITIPGALGASYTLATASTNDNGARFSCVLSNSLGSLISAVSVLTVVPDTTAPVLVGVANTESNKVEVTFSEPVDWASASVVANYSINNGAGILGVSPGGSPEKVVLTTTSLGLGGSYTITVNNVRDRAAARNQIPANSQKTFTCMLKGIYREIFTGVPGSYLSDLSNSPAFPSHPSNADYFVSSFQMPTNSYENYGQRWRAKVIPPVTGNYRFWITADDTAALYLGTNDTPTGARLIASATWPGHLSAGQWDIQTNQQSALISLVAGQQYYIEALMQDGVGTGFPADHLAVRWQLPTGGIEEPIPLSRLTPYGFNPPIISQHPLSTEAVEGGTATFQIVVSNVDVINYQWRLNGSIITGATNAFYTASGVQLTDNGTLFDCYLWNAAGSITSAPALLTVSQDMIAPEILSVQNIGTNKVVVVFSEPVDPYTASDVYNYNLGAVAITSATLGSDSRTVTLNCSSLALEASYTLMVNGVQDRASMPNPIMYAFWTFTAESYYTLDIGGADLPGSVVVTNTGLDMVAGDGSISGLSDHFKFSYQQRSGDFDLKFRVSRLEFADAWTQAGLVARKDLGSNSAYAAVFATPSIIGNFFQWRATNAATPQMSGTYPVNYPNTWLRLKRRNGTEFTGWASYDGQTWTQLGMATLPDVSANMYVGFTVLSHNPAQTAQALFRDFTTATGAVTGAWPTAVEPLGPSTRRTGLVISEIMYHPRARTDGRSVEFIELFNSNPFPEDMSGYRISGDVDYVFPAGTILQGGAYLVVARSPSDIQAVYGISNVTGPYTNNLSNKAGTVRLRNQGAAILLEVNYDSRPPWPAAPDGTGHSLVLARPSYGENNPKAWAQSDLVNGSPGRGDGIGAEPLRGLVINEFLAHTVSNAVDYIELYNNTPNPMDITGCWLTDDPSTNKFLIEYLTILQPYTCVSYSETTLGFGMDSGGEGIFLLNPYRNRVLDAVKFQGQENGISTGRYPDGAPGWYRMSSQTPGVTNSPPRRDDIVINEIMYHPITDDDNDEFVELYNRGTNTIDLSGWQFTDGIDFTFPSNTFITPNGYLVVAKNAAQLIGKNTGTLNSNNTVGNYGGALGNGGERLALSKLDYRASTNKFGVLETNAIYVEIDSVEYGTGGRWGKWSDGGGSSLELIDPRSDNRLAPNWADSESTNSQWSTLSVTGMLDNGNDSPSSWDSLQLYLLDPGECLVDEVYVTIGGVSGWVTNSSLESFNSWVTQGNHKRSYIDNGGSPGKCLHVVATDRGDDMANRIFQTFIQQYGSNVTGTITAKVRWLHGRPEILFRLRGGLLELPGVMTVPQSLGTPGKRNSRYAANVGPAITEVSHSPVLPAANQPVLVTARLNDPDGITSAKLIYRIDPNSTTNVVQMLDNGTGGDAVAGDGIYSATIPGQPGETLVAFYVQATDGYAPAATKYFPAAAPTNECLVRFGEPQTASGYGTYRMWMTYADMNEWIADKRMSSDFHDVTFVYGNNRVVYNAGAHYAGSPAHALLFDSPIGTNCDYQLELPADDVILNATAIRLQQPGAFGLDSTCQNEQLGYWIANRLNIPYLNRRSVNLFINGQRRYIIFEDTQRENADYIEEWYPKDSEGDLYRVGYWYEFSDDAESHNNTPPTLLPILTTGGAKKTSVYRMMFSKRAVKDSCHNFTNLFELVDLLNTSLTGDQYAGLVQSEMDTTEWAKAFAVERIINNTDLYGNLRTFGPKVKGGGQNAFLYKPTGSGWNFLIWDVDAGFTGLPTDNLFNFTDWPISNYFAQPFALRAYWEALEDAAYGPLDPAQAFPLVDGKYAAFRASGINVQPPDIFKKFLTTRREYIFWLLSTVRSDFRITSPTQLVYTNTGTMLTISGVAPISARTITINGLAWPLTWSSITNWTVQLPLTGSSNNISIQAYDSKGNLLSNGSVSLTVFYNGRLNTPQESLVINEIMYNPAVSNAHYIEIYNRSTNTTFSLWNYRLHGVDFNFKPGTIIGPKSYLMVVKDTLAYFGAYGTNSQVAGEYKGNLDSDGETLSLWKQAAVTNLPDILIDKVKYGGIAPWPTNPAKTNSGYALQLIDASQDNARVSNWDDGTGWHFYTWTGQPGGSSLYLWLTGAGEVYVDDISFVFGNVPATGSNYVRNGSFEAPLSGTWSYGSSSGNNSTISSAFAHSGANSLRLSFSQNGSGGSSGSCLYQALTPSPSVSSNYTLSFWYKPSTNAPNLTIRIGSSGVQPSISVRPVKATPGSSNWVATSLPPYPPLWINEVLPSGTNGAWLELFNNGTTNLYLDGYFLANNYTNLMQWAFPTGTFLIPGEFRVLYADAHPELSTGAVLHTSFLLSPTNGQIALSRGQMIMDYITYTNVPSEMTYGSWPDGQLFDRQRFWYPTPGASNNPAPIPVVINEWMASNTRTTNNASTLTYSDWFELYNNANVAVDLSGYFLTDDPGNKNKWRIPNGVTIGPNGFLLCWADGDTTGTNMSGNALHTSFNISKSADEIGLFSPEGITVDLVRFGAQTADVSQGRYLDGNVNGVYYFMPTPTPGTPNFVTNNVYGPVLAAITNFIVNEGALVTFTSRATDADRPVQQLTYSLTIGAPEGAVVNPNTGVFTWRPVESQGGAIYEMTVVVSDNGNPPLMDSKTFTVTVNKINTPPVVAAIPDQTVELGNTVSLAISAVDNDLPPQTLTYSFLAAPPSANLSSSGQFTWTPDSSYVPSTNRIVLTVADNGVPALITTQSFTITVEGFSCVGLKGDVAPRVGGNGGVNLQDWVQVGLFAVRLATCSNACEFNKADCAPKPCGNGVIDLADWVQTGLYAVQLDTPSPVCNSAASPRFSPLAMIQLNGQEERPPSPVSMNPMVVEEGCTNTLQVVLQAQGDENTVGFTLEFDPNVLAYVTAEAGTNAVNTEGDRPPGLMTNTTSVAGGLLGVAFSTTLGTTLLPGSNMIVEIKFRALETDRPIRSAIKFADYPVKRQIVSGFALDLTGTFQDGSVVVTHGMRSLFESFRQVENGLEIRMIGPVGKTLDLEVSTNLEHWDPLTQLTNVTGTVDYIDTGATNSTQRFYRIALR